MTNLEFIEMARKVRKDITVGGLEKKLKVAPGTIRNPDGTDARSDKKLETLQKESAKAKKTSAGKTSSKTVPKKTTNTTSKTSDQKAASIRKVRSSPKATSRISKKVSAAIKKTSTKK